MKKYLEQKKSAIVSGMNNNKGFSLVELIIVVAIMAVLMGVLAPQYLRFVENSREQSDATTANEIVKAMTTAMSTIEGVATSGATIVWNGSGVGFGASGTAAPTAKVDAVDAATIATNFYYEVAATLGEQGVKATPSSNWGTAEAPTFTIQVSGGSPVVRVSWTDNTDYGDQENWDSRLNLSVPTT